MSAIEAHGLVKHFGSVRAADDLSFTVPRGKIFGYLGPNGAGKTTTIRMLLGLIPPDEGHATVLGDDVASRPEAIRRRCGVLLEHDGLYERLSIEDNLTFHARQYGMPKDTAAVRAAELLAHTEWSGRSSEPAAQLSRGMKRRLAVLRSFMTSPELVFLDEPTSGFDPKVAADLRIFLKDVSREYGTTVFLTTHNMQEAESMCDEVAVLRAGRVIASGAPGSLLGTGPRLRIVGSLDTSAYQLLARRKEVAQVDQTPEGALLHLHDDVPAAPILASLVRKGIAIEEVHKIRSSLEEDFIALMEEP